MAELISQRLSRLRKHLGERLGQDLTLSELAEMCGIKDYMIQRLENGLKGNTQTLVTLLNFYRSHDYNLDWILTTDNSRLPMMISDGNELLKLSEEMMQVSQLLEKGYTRLNSRLRNMGYQAQLVEEESELPEPAGMV